MVNSGSTETHFSSSFEKEKESKHNKRGMKGNRDFQTTLKRKKKGVENPFFMQFPFQSAFQVARVSFPNSIPLSKRCLSNGMWIPHAWRVDEATIRAASFPKQRHAFLLEKSARSLSLNHIATFHFLVEKKNNKNRRFLLFNITLIFHEKKKCLTYPRRSWSGAPARCPWQTQQQPALPCRRRTAP